MTNEELAALVQSGQRENTLMLWEQVRCFAIQQARRWVMIGRGGVELADLEQAAFLALLDTLESWNPERGQFLTLYGFLLKQEFSAATGQRTQRDRLDPLDTSTSLDMPVKDDTDAATLGEFIPDPAAERAVNDVAERDFSQHRRRALFQALSDLPATQRHALISKYWRGETVNAKAHHAALRALRQPNVSRKLRPFLV